MRDDKNEIHWDKTLRIRTSGRDDSRADQFRYPYEPTPYSVLERLVNTGLIRKGNVLLDYGCRQGPGGFLPDPVRPGAARLESNTMNGSGRKRKKTEIQVPLL